VIRRLGVTVAESPSRPLPAGWHRPAAGPVTQTRRPGPSQHRARASRAGDSETPPDSALNQAQGHRRNDRLAGPADTVTVTEPHCQVTIAGPSRTDLEPERDSDRPRAGATSTL
jgi:hypothetical protein